MNKAKFASALKALDAGPRRIHAAREKLSAEIAKYNSDECKKLFGETYRENGKRAAQEEYGKVVKSEVDNMRTALETVKEGRSFDDARLNISDPKLKDALALISTLGRDLSPADQLAIIEDFRGDIGNLRVLAQVYERNGLYYASRAKDMTATISQEAIDNLEYCLNKYDVGLGWDDASDAKLYWTQNEFSEALERYGFADAGDPYEAELARMRREYTNPEARQAAAHATMTFREGNLSESEKATLFNDTVSAMKTATDKEEDMSLRWENAQYRSKELTRNNT